MASKTFIDQVTVVDADWLNDIDGLRYGNGDASRGSELLQFVQSGAGAVPRSSQVRDRELTISITDFGAVGDGVTPNDAAILAAVTECKVRGPVELVIPPGVFFVTNTATFDLPNNSTLTFLGSIKSSITTAIPTVRIGSTTTNIFGLRVSGVNVTRSTMDTTYATIGVELRNLAFSNVDIKYVNNFSHGVIANGTQANGGFSYNQVSLSFLHDNTINLRLTASGVGYCNENVFHGGSFNHSSGYPAVATVNIEVDHFVGSPLNNNRFICPSLEDSGAVAIRRAANLAGFSNMIFYPRMENPTDQANYLINITANATNCVVDANSFQVLNSNITDNGIGSKIKTTQGEQLKYSTPAGGLSVHSAQSYATSSARVYQGRDSGGTETFFVLGDGSLKCRTIAATNMPVTTSAPPAGGAGVLPATPKGYLTLDINGVTTFIPYYQ